MNRTARLILNPAAGTDAAPEHAENIATTLRERHGEMETVLTAAAGDGERAARQAALDGCDRLFVGGGDGTLNEAINGVASVKGALERTTFGLIPLGTGNDFAAAMGIPAGVEGALAVIAGGHVQQVDLGSVNGRVFANISGGGFIADVSEAVTPQMKSIAGRLAYLVGGAQVLMDLDPIRAAVHSEPGAVDFTTSLYAFAVCNSRLIGGGKLIAPHAVINDGLLDLCIIDSMPTLEFIALLRQVAQGTHTEDPRVRYLRVADLTIEFDRPININTDGEVLEASTCHYRVLPGAARFFAGEAVFADQPQKP